MTLCTICLRRKSFTKFHLGKILMLNFLRDHSSPQVNIAEVPLAIHLQIRIEIREFEPSEGGPGEAISISTRPRTCSTNPFDV